MIKDLEKVAPNKRDTRIEELERRIKYCEEVARQYKYMYDQLESKLKAFNDRQGNIQLVYDYLTRVGSEIAIKTPHQKKFLNPITKTLPKDTAKYLEMLKKFKFQIGDEVYYANEKIDHISYHLVNDIDIIDGHPRYCLEGLIGYTDESKIFATKEQAQWQLDEWEKKLMPVNKETILDAFQTLTEIEVDTVKDVIKSNPKKNSDIGSVYLMAINRCRQLLEVILKDK